MAKRKCNLSKKPPKKARVKGLTMRQKLKRLSRRPKSNTPLLSLAAELRTKIWEYVLISSKPIEIRLLNTKYRTNTGQPGLLTTSRQIRAETIGIWYNMNEFTFKSCSFNYAPYHGFCKLLRKYHQDPAIRVSCEPCQGSHRREVQPFDLGELTTWLQLYHRDPSLVPGPPQDGDAFLMASRTMAVHTFGVVLNMQDRPWWVVEEVLAPFLDAILLLARNDRHRLAELEIYSDEEDYWPPSGDDGDESDDEAQYLQTHAIGNAADMD